MEKALFTLQKGLQLREIGKQYIIVRADENSVNVSDVYSLNRTAAWMWKRMSEGSCSLDDLANALCDAFDIGFETAKRDAEKQLAEWKSFGLIL